MIGLPKPGPQKMIQFYNYTKQKYHQQPYSHVYMCTILLQAYINLQGLSECNNTDCDIAQRSTYTDTMTFVFPNSA